jgi:transposase
MPHYSDEDRILIKNLRLEKHWGAKKMIAFFPNKPWTLSGIEGIIRRVDLTGNHARKEGSGRPKTVRREENIHMVKEMICSQEGEPGMHKSPREIAKETGIHRSSVQRIVKRDLKLNVFKRMEIHELSENDRERRADRAQQLLNKYPTDRYVQRIWFSDEKMFSVASPINHQNDRVYSEEKKKCNVPSENLLHERKHFSQKIMVSVAVSYNGKTPIIFIEPGTKVDKHYYIRHLEKELLPSIRQQSGRHWTFMQDSAPSHRAAATIAFLEANTPDFISPDLWPPNSPDLNCVDYSIWGALEERVYRNKRIKTLQQLKNSIIEEWNIFPQEFIKEAIDQWTARLVSCVLENGGHVEHLF